MRDLIVGIAMLAGGILFTLMLANHFQARAIARPSSVVVFEPPHQFGASAEQAAATKRP